MSITKDDTEFVQSLARGLAVIRVFGPEHQRLTLTEVAGRAGMTRAAARRFLLTLKALGYVGCLDGKNFFLQPQVLNLGYAYLSSIPWWETAQRFMEEITAAVNESCSAAVLDGQDIVYVARVSTRRIMTLSIGIGTRLPAYATSMGRVLLSHLQADELEAYLKEVKLEKRTDRTVTQKAILRKILQEVRQQGYSINDQELESGLRSVAVPILDRNGKCLAAINVSTQIARVPKAQLLGAILPVLIEGARKITLALPR